MAADNAVPDDGFDTTVELDCGCTVRRNSKAGVPMVKVGDWTSCFQHSAEADSEYLSRARDRRVVVVRPDGQGRTKNGTEMASAANVRRS